MDAALKRQVQRDRVRKWREKIKAGVNAHRLNINERFDSYTCYAGDCIAWIGRSSDGRYGRFWFNGKEVQAHRFSYERVYGSIQDGLQLDHLCRNTFCVNPAHLEPVTPRVNWERGDAPAISGKHHRIKTHCPKGHPYSGDNLYILKSKNYRYCRSCMAENTAKWAIKKGAK